MAINKTTQYTTDPNTIPVDTSTGSQNLDDALNSRADFLKSAQVVDNFVDVEDGAPTLIKKGDQSGLFLYDATSTDTPDGGTIVEPSFGGRYVRWLGDGILYSGYFDTFANAVLAAENTGRPLMLSSDVELSSTLVMKNKYHFSTNGYVLKPAATFTATDSAIVVVSPQTSFTTDYFSGSIGKMEIDGASKTGLNGFRVNYCQNLEVDRVFVENLYATAIRQEAGYEFILNSYYVIAPNDAHTVVGVSTWKFVPGLWLRTSDAHIKEGVAVQYGIGLQASGANNRIQNIHNWSTYQDDIDSRPRLSYGFDIEGEGNYLSNCMADSPNSDGTSTASSGNGGVGFRIRGNGINCYLHQCQVFVLNNANTPTNGVLPYRLEQSFCDLVSCNVRDASGVAVTSNITYSTATVETDTLIFGGTLGR